MAIELFKHNQEAYDAVIAMLAETGKACVIHPTGTGKSFIAFKYCEDYPDQRVVWLSPSEYIFKTQCENLAATGAEVPGNIEFYTYQKLCWLSQEEIRLIQLDALILDEMHRALAQVWMKPVETLLSQEPCPIVLGLTATNIRFLDGQKDSASLVDFNIASQMSLGEAIVRGVLTAPLYITGLLSIQSSIEKYERRLKKTKSKASRDRGEKLIEALRRTIEKADGLNEIFERNITNRSGKYLVFCSNYEHMQEMVRLADDHFGEIDPEAHIYTVFSNDPCTSKAFKDFKDDNSEHLKLLYSVNMLNEGVHVDDVDGVILFRPTVSPVVYKQQIGRALTVSNGKNAVIFDIVDNISNLYSIGAIQEEMENAVHFYRERGMNEEVVNETFQIIDEVRNVRELFETLENTLSTPWDVLYAEAKKYYSENHDLRIPQSYITEDGYQLGKWLVSQRTMYSNGILSQSHIQRLELIGMDWQTRNSRIAEKHLQEAKEYVKLHGNLLPPVTTRLGQWLYEQRKRRKLGLLTAGEEKALNDIGMVWDVNQEKWEDNLRRLKEYFQQYGNVDISPKYVTDDGIQFGLWCSRIKKQYREGKLTNKQKQDLEDAGFLWTTIPFRYWLKMYHFAESYYREHGHLCIPCKYITEDGSNLGKWIVTQRRNYKSGALRQEQVEMLEQIHMIWDVSEAQWERGYQELLSYVRIHGNANIVRECKTENDFNLGFWIVAQRKKYKDGQLDFTKVSRLEQLGVVWSVNESKWKIGISHARKYFSEHGNLEVPYSYQATDGYNLGTWLSTQRGKYRRGKMTNEEIDVLESLGIHWKAQNNVEIRKQGQD